MPGRRRRAPAAGAGVLVALAGCAGVSGNDGAGAAPTGLRADGPEIHGTFDYGWSVRRPDGTVAPLAAHRGRVLVLNLWATWCPPCVSELATLGTLAGAVADLEVDVLLVSPEDPGTVEAFAARHGYEVPLLTEERRAPESLGPLVLPTTFVVDREGTIVLRHRGAADWSAAAVVAFVRALAGDASVPEAGR